MSYQHSYCWLVSWFSPFMWHLSPPQVLYHYILTAPESLSTSSEFSFFFFPLSSSSFSTRLHSLLYSLYSSFSFLIHEALSNSEECTTFTELINYFFHTDFTSSCLMWDTSRNSERAKQNWIYFLLCLFSASAENTTILLALNLYTGNINSSFLL